MPSGRVHDRITVVGAIVAAPAYYFLAPPTFHSPVSIAVLAGATLFSGLFLSPDLDLNSSIYHRWGPLRCVWWPYQKLIHHRSPLSHSCFVGPILRIAYFLLMFWALFRIVSYGIAAYIHPFNRNALSIQYTDSFLHFWRTHPSLLIAASIGMILGASLHVGADLIVTGVKRKQHHPHRRR